eukprot:m.37653 g.37653  ORF g.37653 m.37653 type:complete len:188 (-) comp10115_c0_seq4:221-784(-)
MWCCIYPYCHTNHGKISKRHFACTTNDAPPTITPLIIPNYSFSLIPDATVQHVTLPIEAAMNPWLYQQYSCLAIAHALCLKAVLTIGLSMLPPRYASKDQSYYCALIAMHVRKEQRVQLLGLSLATHALALELLSSRARSGLILALCFFASALVHRVSWIIQVKTVWVQLWVDTLQARGMAHTIIEF